LIGRLAENTAAAFAQVGTLPAHAGRDPLDVGNFPRTEAENISGAKPPLILLREGMARCRQHRQAESQAGHDFEISGREPNRSHRCPQKSTDVTATPPSAVRRLGINDDRIGAIGLYKIAE